MEIEYLVIQQNNRAHGWEYFSENIQMTIHSYCIFSCIHTELFSRDQHQEHLTAAQTGGHATFF